MCLTACHRLGSKSRATHLHIFVECQTHHSMDFIFFSATSESPTRPLTSLLLPLVPWDHAYVYVLVVLLHIECSLGRFLCIFQLFQEPHRPTAFRSENCSLHNLVAIYVRVGAYIYIFVYWLANNTNVTKSLLNFFTDLFCIVFLSVNVHMSFR